MKEIHSHKHTANSLIIFCYTEYSSIQLFFTYTSSFSLQLPDTFTLLHLFSSFCFSLYILHSCSSLSFTTIYHQQNNLLPHRKQPTVSRKSSLLTLLTKCKPNANYFLKYIKLNIFNKYDFFFAMCLPFTALCEFLMSFTFG